MNLNLNMVLLELQSVEFHINLNFQPLNTLTRNLRSLEVWIHVLITTQALVRPERFFFTFPFHVYQIHILMLKTVVSGDHVFLYCSSRDVLNMPGSYMTLVAHGRLHWLLWQASLHKDAFLFHRGGGGGVFNKRKKPSKDPT